VIKLKDESNGIGDAFILNTCDGSVKPCDAEKKKATALIANAKEMEAYMRDTKVHTDLCCEFP